MPVVIHVDSGDAERRLARVAHIIADLRGFWPLVVPLFIKWMGRQFESEGGYLTGHWTALTPEYAAWKATAHPGKGILIATGKLRASASKPERTMTANTLTLTITDRTAGYHQEGTSRMPARPLVSDNLPATAVNELERAMAHYVTEALKAV